MTYLDILSALIGFDTTTRRDTLEAVEWARDYLSGYGVTSRLVYNAAGARATLVATVGDGDESGPILSGHLDVVPADDPGWTFPPFSLTERDGKFYGRGTSDMKGAIAVALARVPDFLRRGRKVHLVLSHDEEVAASAPRTPCLCRKSGRNWPRRADVS